MYAMGRVLEWHDHMKTFLHDVVKSMWLLKGIWFGRAWAVFGAMIAIVSVLGVPKWFYGHSYCGRFSILGCILLVLLAAFIFFTLARSTVEVWVDGVTKLRVFYGDIFKQEGAIVIPVNNYFDVHIGDNVVSPRTLHGQFVEKVYDGDEDALRKDICAALEGVGVKPKIVKRSDVRLPNQSYPIGTCLRLNKDGKIYILVVTSEFDQSNHARLSHRQYYQLLNGLYAGVSTLHDDNPVYMPLIGSGQSNIGCSNMQLLVALVGYAKWLPKLTNHNGLNVVLCEGTKWSDRVQLSIVDLLFNKVNLKECK